MKVIWLVLLLFSKCWGLIWPSGGSKILVITGFGVPVDIDPETVIIGSVIKGNYVLPTNASFSQTPGARARRAATRWDMYEILAKLLEMRGFGGKECVLRAICEIARSPLERNYGLLHELLHVFFTPSATNEDPATHADQEYYKAQVLGRKRGDCGRVFYDCSSSFIDLFTTFY